MLQLKHIEKTFNPGTVNEKRALTDLNLDLKDGDFATIVGSNGAGKSTMFNAITGAFYVDEGQIILDGEDITYKKEYLRSHEIGHLFQDPLRGTAPGMTIEENMALAYLRAKTMRNQYFSRINKADKEKFREQLALLDMGLEDRMKQPVCFPEKRKRSYIKAGIFWMRRIWNRRNGNWSCMRRRSTTGSQRYKKRSAEKEKFVCMAACWAGCF